MMKENCSVSKLSFDCVKEEHENVTKYENIETGLVEFKRQVESNKQSVYLRNSSIFYSKNGVEFELSVVRKSRKCVHGVADSVEQSSITPILISCSSTICTVVDDHSTLWQFPIAEIKPGCPSEAVQVLAPQYLKFVKLVAGKSHFVALVERREENEEDTVVFRDDQSIDDVFVTSSCHLCRENDSRLSALMLEADKAALGAGTSIDKDELKSLHSNMKNCHKKRSLSTNAESVTSERRSVRLRACGRARTLSATHEGNEPSPLPKLTMEEICESEGRSKSLETASQLDFSFVSMDRVSIREKMEEHQSSPCSSPSSSRLRKSAAKGSELTEENSSRYEVWTWGANYVGQLGLGDMVDRTTPTHLQGLDDCCVVDVCCGSDHCAVLTGAGEVYIWGRNVVSSTGDESIRKPRVQKLGADMFATALVSSQSLLWILLLSRDLSVILLRCGEVNGRKSTTRVVLNKDEVPVRLAVIDDGLLLLKTSKTKNISEILHLYFEGAKYCHLFKGLLEIAQRLNSLGSGNHTDTMVPSCDALYRTHSSILSRVTGSLAMCSTFTVSHVYSLLSTSVYLLCLHDAIHAYAISEAAGFLHNNEFSDSLENNVSRLALEHGTESSNTSSKIGKLFLRSVGWLTYLVSAARETLAVSQDESLRSILNPVIMKWNSTVTLLIRNIECAKVTRKAWKDKRWYSLRETGRFLLGTYEVEDQLKKASVVLPKSRTSLKISAIFVFSDILVIEERRSTFRTYPLHLVWTVMEEGLVRLITPELEIMLEFHKDTTSFQLVCSYWFDSSLEGTKVPSRRRGTHVFSHDCSREHLQRATYDGEWRNGRLHGRGSLTLPNGDVHKGLFLDDRLHGFGEIFRVVVEPLESSGFMSTFYVPSPVVTDKYDIFRGVFNRGELNGLAQIRYADGKSFDGYVEEMIPNGFGVVRGKSLYIGSFKNGHPEGYGVSATNKKKCLGEFVNGEMSGRGTVVTIDGSILEGDWLAGFMKRGIIICGSTDGSPSLEYEGETSGWGDIGKQGRLRVSPSVTLEGSFSGNIFGGQVRVLDAVLSTNNSALSPVHHMVNSDGPTLSKYAVPIEHRWRTMISIFLMEELGVTEETDPDCATIWSSIVWGMNRGKELVQGDVRQGFCDALERIPNYEEDWSSEYYAMTTEYWRLSLDNAFHPLQRLFIGCVEVFVASYGDVAAHSFLHSHAILELLQLIQQIYCVVRYLFPSLPENCFAHVPSQVDTPLLMTSPESSPEHGCSDSSTRIEVPIPACNFIYEKFFPRCWQVIFTMYTINNVEMDEKYWARAVYLNAHTDVKLLAHLGIRRDLWPIQFDSTNTRDLDKPFIVTTARDKFYKKAVYSIQKITTETNPTEKLRFLAATFQTMQTCVKEDTEIGARHTLSCDDLLPAFIYVVIRSQIRHLGSEIQLMDDFSRDFRGGGEIGMMFTMLQSTYFYICREKSLV